MHCDRIAALNSLRLFAINELPKCFCRCRWTCKNLFLHVSARSLNGVMVGDMEKRRWDEYLLNLKLLQSFFLVQAKIKDYFGVFSSYTEYFFLFVKTRKTRKCRSEAPLCGTFNYSVTPHFLFSSVARAYV